MTIIKYYTTFLGMTNPTYEVVSDPRKKGKVIDKEDAIKKIKKLGLIKVYQDKDGTIWDSPNKEFYETHKGVGNEINEV